MNLSNIPEKIFDLLASKTFEELTKEEREMVLGSFTEEEYSALSEGVQGFMEADSTIRPVLANAPKAIGNKGGISGIVNYPIPLYQVAAGLLLLLGIYLMMPDYRSEANMDLSAVRDTIQTGTPLSADRYPDKLIFNP